MKRLTRAFSVLACVSACACGGQEPSPGSSGVATQVPAASPGAAPDEGAAESLWAVLGTSPSPLSTTKFIDVGTSTPPRAATGSIDAPYASISAWLKATGEPLSASSANTTQIGVVSPGVYTENLQVPAYRNLEIVAPADQPLTGNVTWTNVAPDRKAVRPTSNASLTLQRIAVSGNLTVTDDGSVPSSVYVLDDSRNTYANIGGDLDLSHATAVSLVDVSGAYVAGNIRSTAGSTGASVDLTNAEVDGNITCQYLFVQAGCFFYGSSFTVSTTAEFLFDATFYSSNPVISGGSQATFDGPSWASFRGAGGTVVPPMVAVVRGGYLAGDVPGADYVDQATPVTVAIDGGGASPGYTTGGNHTTVPPGTLTADRVLVLGTSGASSGDSYKITRLDAGPFTFTVQNDDGSMSDVMPAGKMSSSLWTFDGTHFQLTDPGNQ
jgi:hypothetical protein